MEMIYTTGQGTAAELQTAMPDPPTYSTVRTLLRILEEKGHLTHRLDGQRYVYLPIQPLKQAARSSLRHVLNTFFSGSVEQAVATLMEAEDTRISPEELERLSALIERARQKEQEVEEP
jgi:predicted transcriptional regulator